MLIMVYLSIKWYICFYLHRGSIFRKRTRANQWKDLMIEITRSLHRNGCGYALGAHYRKKKGILTLRLDTTKPPKALYLRVAPFCANRKDCCDITIRDIIWVCVYIPKVYELVCCMSYSSVYWYHKGRFSSARILSSLLSVFVVED